MNGIRLSLGRYRPIALTIPAVTVFSNPNGEPIAGDPLADFESGHRTDLYFPQPRGVDLDQRDVRIRIQAHHSRLEFAAIDELDRHFADVRDEMRVRKDVSVFADDESGAHVQPPEFERVGREEAPEEIRQGIVGRESRVAALAHAARGARRADVDHGRPFAPHQAREVGTGRALRGERRRAPRLRGEQRCRARGKDQAYGKQATQHALH
jgi:hypothetical protein